MDVGISGLGEILEKGLEVMDSPDVDVKKALLAELKVRNYVPRSVEREYMTALWSEYKKARTLRREQLEESYQGIPREEIPWFPVVDPELCSGCSSCVEFCIQGVFTFDGKSHVAKPYNCIVGNTSCRSFCPEKAIAFPPLAQLKSRLKSLRKKHGLA